MVNKKTPFKINKKIMTEVIDIAESVGKVSISNQISANPTLRRTDRIRTIYSSLAPPKDIAEVQNAYEIYENMDNIFLPNQ